jgi:hypothetical protein
MAFFKSLIIASVAAVALAQGAAEKNTKVDVGSQSGGAKCGNGQKLACCNSGEDLIGLNCLSVPIRMLTLQSDLLIVYSDNHPSRHSHPAGLRFQRRCLLPDR